MEKIYLKDFNNNSFEADFIRFFRFKNTKYLIYSKNEVDEKGYVKLYLVKVMEELGEKIARSIKDEYDWDNMQNIVKTVIKEIRNEKIESFIDLDKNELEDLKIMDTKYFKLDPNLVNILSSNHMLGIEKNDNIEEISDSLEEQTITNDEIEYNENFNLVSEENETNEIITENIIENSSIDYKSLYENTLKEKEELSEILTNMVIELTNYKVKYGVLEENNNL